MGECTSVTGYPELYWRKVRLDFYLGQILESYCSKSVKSAESDNAYERRSKAKTIEDALI